MMPEGAPHQDMERESRMEKKRPSLLSNIRERLMALERPATAEHQELSGNEIIQAIQQAPINEILDLFHAGVDESDAIQALPQEAATALLVRLFENPSTNNKLSHLGSFDGGIPIQRTIQDRELLCDKYMNALASLYRTHPEQTATFFQAFGQQSHMLKFETYMGASLQMLADPKLPPRIRTDIIAGLAYDAAFNYLDRFEHAIAGAEGLKGGQTLDMLALVSTYGRDWDFSEEAADRLQETIRAFASTAENYYAAKRAEAIVRQENFTQDWSTQALRAAVEQTRDLLNEFGIEIEEEYLETRAYLEWFILENADIFQSYMNWCVFNGEAERQADHNLESRMTIPWLKKGHGMVKRIAKGKIGIYTSDFKLFGFIDDARLASELPIMREEVSTIVETPGLFSADMDLNRQRDLMSDLQSLHDFRMRQTLEKDFGFRYEDLTLNEQLWFLEFLQDKKKSEVAPVAKFIKTFGTDGLRAFAALEHDGAAAEAIFAIAEKLPETRARAVFKKYVELAESAGTLDAQAQTFFATPAIGQENVERRATAELMKRAARLLKDFAAWAKDKNVQGLQDALDAINQDVLIFASIFKTAFDERKGKLDFAEVRGLDFEERPTEFTPVEII